MLTTLRHKALTGVVRRDGDGYFPEAPFSGSKNFSPENYSSGRHGQRAPWLQAEQMYRWDDRTPFRPIGVCQDYSEGAGDKSGDRSKLNIFFATFTGIIML